MKITNQLSIATLVLAGVFATGCSQQQVSGGSQSAGSQQVSGGSQVAGGSQQSAGGSQVAGGGSQQAGSQQQVEAPAPVVVAPVAVAPAPAPVAAPAPVNRWGHTHPAIPRCTNSIRHTHKYNSANHSHRYSCRAAAPRAAQPQVDVRALQQKLKAKGYYKGPIDGVVGPSTRSALQRFMQR